MRSKTDRTKEEAPFYNIIQTLSTSRNNQIYNHLPKAIKDLSGNKNKFKLAIKNIFKQLLL